MRRSLSHQGSVLGVSCLALGLAACGGSPATTSASTSTSGAVTSGAVTSGGGGGSAGSTSSAAAGGAPSSTSVTSSASASGNPAGTGGSPAGSTSVGVSSTATSSASGSTSSSSGTGAGGADGGTPPPPMPGTLVNGLEWADTAGNPIQAHGGGMLKVGSYYYWFGENRNPDGTFYAVSCYRSTDLVTWEPRGNVLTENSAAELKPANIERPKVVFNASTNQYVMWMHWENGSDYGQARAAVASSSAVDGPYTYHGSFRPLVSSGVMDHGKPGYMSRDSTLFVDTDGSAYFLSASNENNDLNLYKLSNDYLTVGSLVAVLFPGGHREAPALFKRNNVYFLITSDATGWTPNQAKYATSTKIGSGWSGWNNLGDSTTFSSQSTFVLPVQGASGTAYLYMGDRWAGAWSGPVNDSTYIWEPLTFGSTTSTSMTWSNTLTLDAAAGTVTGANNSFKLVNKGSGKVMEVSNASTTDGGAVVQLADSGASNQKWTLNYDGAGYFRLTNVNSTRVLDVPSSAKTDGTALEQWTDNGGDNQKWRLDAKAGGYYTIKNKNSGKLLGITGASSADNATVEQRASSGADNQLWKLVIAH